MKIYQKNVRHSSIFKYWNPVVVTISVFIIVSYTLETLGNLSLITNKSLFHLDLLVSLVFMADFFLTLHYSHNRKKFFKKSWPFLFISFPFLHIAYWLKLPPTVGLLFFLQTIRLLRSARGLSILVRIISERKSTTILGTYALYLATTLYFASLTFYTFEQGVNPNVNSYFDAVWWSIITVTTVGYGDIAPVTIAGRVIAIVLILGGMGLFSVITAYLSSNFLKMYDQKEKAQADNTEN